MMVGLLHAAPTIHEQEVAALHVGNDRLIQPAHTLLFTIHGSLNFLKDTGNLHRLDQSFFVCDAQADHTGFLRDEIGIFFRCTMIFGN
jgi:hypothetical protein